MKKLLLIAMLALMMPGMQLMAQTIPSITIPYTDNMGTGLQVAYPCGQITTANPAVFGYTFVYYGDGNSTSGIAPQDGQYAIVNNTLYTPTDSHGNALQYSYAGQEYGWLSSLTDHTSGITTTQRINGTTYNEGPGAYLLINANSAQVFYQVKATNVVATNSVTVSFWAENVINPAITTNGSGGGNVTFLKPSIGIVVKNAVTGSVLGSLTPTTLGQTGVWTQYTVTVNAGAATSILVQLQDVTAAGVGNDIAIDDVSITQATCVAPAIPTAAITTQPTCPTPTGTVTVSNIKTTPFTITNALSTPADTILSTNISSATANKNGEYLTITSTGSGASLVYTAVINKVPAGTYDYAVTNATGCSTAALTPVVVLAPTAVTGLAAAVTQPVCNVGTTGTITATSTGAVSYTMDGTTTNTTGIFTNVAAGTHTIVATSATLCTASTTAYVYGTNYTWAGTTSSDPTIGSNWVGGVAPTFADGSCSITIPNVTSPAVYPTLNANAPLFKIFNLTISGSAATLNLNGYVLYVGCNIVNTAGGLLTYNSNYSSGITWNGVGPTQTFSGNTTTINKTMFADMTVANTYVNGATVGTISINGILDIYDVLTMTQGNLAVTTSTGTLLTLKSLQTHTAAVAEIKSAGTGIAVSVITGSVNVERYITGVDVAYRGYRLLSSPVYVNSFGGLNYLGLKYIETSTPSNAGALVGGPGTGGGTTTGGVPPNSNGFTVTNPNGSPTIYYYNEALNQSNTNFISGKDVGISAFTGTPAGLGTATGPSAVSTVNGYPTVTTKTNQNIPVGNGYIFYFIGNNTNYQVYGNLRAAIEPTTITAVGSLNQGTIPVTIMSTGTTSLSWTANTGPGVLTAGINMIGNPYACTLDLNTFYSDNWTSSNNIGNIFYEMNEPGQNYLAYDKNGSHTSSTRASRYVASGQGFMVIAGGTNESVSFSEDQKAPTVQLTPTGSTLTPPTQLILSIKNPAVDPGIHLQLFSDSVTNTQTGIYFSTAGSDSFSKKEDALDIGGPSPKVYLSSYTSDGVKVGINELSNLGKGKRVKLFVNAATAGAYHLGLVDIKDIDTVYNVYLVDKSLKDSVNLRTTKTYDFNISSSDTTSYGANRFEIAVSLKALPPYHLLAFTGQKVTTGVQLNWTTANASTYTGFTVQKLSDNQYVPLTSLQSDGSAAYAVVDTHPATGANNYRLMQNGVIGDITYSSIVTVNYNNLASNNVLSVYPNPTIDVINIAVNLPSAVYNLTIYNASGNIVKQFSGNGTYWSQNMAQYIAGTYVVEVHDAKGNFIGKTKFVKAK